MRSSTLCSILVLLATAPCYPTTAMPVQYCTVGCEGSSGSGAGNGTGACTGEALTILASVTSGDCTPESWSPPADPVGCIEDPCQAVVTRSWTGLPPSSGMQFCVKLNGVQYCRTNPPNAGPTGSGSDVQNPTLNCGWTDFEFNFTTACGTTASATESCKACRKS